MTADAVVAPVVRWDPARAQLVTPDGTEATRAQDAKARRYIDGARIQKISTSGESATWGLPWRITETYELAPIPGCRQSRTVQVTSWHDAVGTTMAVDYRCDCQKSGGTVSQRPGICSHALAVHRFRKEDTHA